MRKLQLVLGIILAVGAAVAVLFVGRMTQPATFDVVVSMKEIPAFSQIQGGDISIDTQSVSSAVAEKYIMADEWEQMMAQGPVAAVEPLHPGQPVLRQQVASGADAEGLTRLSVALDNPNQVIVSVPVEQDNLPSLIPGDVVALYFAAGRVSAQKLVTEVVEHIGPQPEEAEPMTTTIDLSEEGRTVTTTIEVDLPVSKQLAEGVVYRLNRERKENPNYGTPGMENEPRYIEGETKALDVVVPKETAEWVTFALSHGTVEIGVLPALTKPSVESGTLPDTEGVTWSDFEDIFFEERGVGKDDDNEQ
jgi:hypothetical protein